MADVDAILFHHGDGTRVHAIGPHTGAEDLGASPGEVGEVAVRDLASATVGGAEYEDAHGQQQELFGPQPHSSPVASFTLAVPSAFGAQQASFVLYADTVMLNVPAPLAL